MTSVETSMLSFSQWQNNATLVYYIEAQSCVKWTDGCAIADIL